MPTCLTATVQVFVFLQLLLKLGLSYIYGGIHINGLLFDDDGLMRHMQRDFTNEAVFILGIGFFKMSFGVNTGPVLPGNIAVQAANFFADIGS